MQRKILFRLSKHCDDCTRNDFSLINFALKESKFDVTPELISEHAQVSFSPKNDEEATRIHGFMLAILAVAPLMHKTAQSLVEATRMLQVVNDTVGEMMKNDDEETRLH